MAAANGDVCFRLSDWFRDALRFTDLENGNTYTTFYVFQLHEFYCSADHFDSGSAFAAAYQRLDEGLGSGV